MPIPDNSKMVFLYVGKSPSGAQYTTYTTNDINSFTDVNQFVICPSPAFTTYGYGDTNHKYPEIVNAVKNLVTTIKSSQKSSAQLWIGTPAVDGNTGSFSNMYTYIKNYINDVKNALGTNWASVKGIYMNGESVWGTVDYSNLMSNPTIKMYNDLAYDIRTIHNKKFLWVPYYSVKESNAVETIKRVGYVTNRTNIFDYVLLQPQYYFNDGPGPNNSEAPRANLDGVYSSMINQAVTYRDGVLVVARSPSATATIGVQMEMDGNIFVDHSQGGYRDRYEEYVSKFSSLVGSYPFSYYMSAKGLNGSTVNYWSDLINEVNDFY